MKAQAAMLLSGMLPFLVGTKAILSPLPPVPFSYTHKPAQTLEPSGEELVLAEHHASFSDNRRLPDSDLANDAAFDDVVHAVTLSWFTVELNWPTFSATVIRYYVDG